MNAMDFMVGMTGAAIALVFALVAAAMTLGFALTVLFEAVRWVLR
jgi:hypothetical protein